MVKRAIVLLCIMPLLLQACVSKPAMAERPQTTQWYYTYTILLTPERPINSPKLEIALSMLQMKSQDDQVEFVYQLLYSTGSIDAYKDRVVQAQKENYRKSLSYLEGLDIENLPIIEVEVEDEETDGWENLNWRFSESFAPISPRSRGIIIERVRETYTGGYQGTLTKRYFVIDLGARKLLKIDDFFDDYQGDRMRDIIYDELRNYSGLGKGQPLSEGIYLNDEPELTFNFFVNEEGLVLHWDPYEIAPYSEGSIQIMLPWKKIRPLMLNSGIELLTKFNIYLFV